MPWWTRWTPHRLPCIQNRWLVVVVVVVVLMVQVSDCLVPQAWSSVYTERAQVLSSYKQLVTSSTLSWVGVEDVQSGRIPASSLVLGGDSAVCRVLDGDEVRAGRTDLSGSCLAGPGWYKHAEYQVLVDLGGLARLEWRPWNMFTSPQIGTVAYNAHTFVGRFTSRQHGGGGGGGGGAVVLVGDLDFNRGLSGNIRAHLNVNTTELSVEGEALVEIEPVGYRLENISLASWREKVQDQVVILGSIRLAREETNNRGEDWREEDDGSKIEEKDDDEDWQEVESSLSYSQNVSRYWGHVAGTVRGLPALATLGHASYSFRWGLPWEGRDEGVVGVRASLRPGTYTIATLQGLVSRREVPYTASLGQDYADTATAHTTATIEGLLTYSALTNLTTVLTPPRYIASDRLAPTTTTTTTTTTTPTPYTTVAAAKEDDSGRLGVQYVERTFRSSHPESDSHLAAPPLPPTLFPPTEPTAPTPNPLWQFYPMEEEEEEEVLVAVAGDEAVRAAQVAAENSGVRPGRVALLLLLLLALSCC